MRYPSEQVSGWAAVAQGNRNSWLASENSKLWHPRGSELERTLPDPRACSRLLITERRREKWIDWAKKNGGGRLSLVRYIIFWWDWLPLAGYGWTLLLWEFASRLVCVLLFLDVAEIWAWRELTAFILGCWLLRNKVLFGKVEIKKQADKETTGDVYINILY